MSGHGKQVAAQEVDELRIPDGVAKHPENDLNVAYVSGSDVFLKERRTLIIVPRETPWNLIHARNVVTVLEAGAVVLSAIPSFYSRPQSVIEVVDTVALRILDQLGLPNPRAFRWKEPDSQTSPAQI